MTFAAADLLGLAAATLAYGPLLVLPGYALASGIGLLAFATLSPTRRWGVAVLTGLALLPWLDATLIRVAGLPAALAGTLALAAVGLVLARREGCRPALGPLGWTCLGVWIAAVAAVWVDLDTANGGLRQPLLVIDLVKHAATTRALVEGGAPPVDAFFAREGRAGYYYFFYAVAALAEVAGGPWIDARAAVGGLAVWTGIGLVALLDRLLDRSRIVADLDPALVRRCLLVFLPVAGLDIIPVGWSGLMSGSYMPMVERWNEQVAWWPTSLIWVPHHVCAMIASLFGLMVLADALERPGRAEALAVAVAVAVAGAALASCVGLSVWVGLGAAATAAGWTAWLALERRWRAVGIVLAAGLAALALDAPHLLDIQAGRTGQEAGVALSVRKFGPLEGLGLDPATLTMARLVVLPFNYYVEFGAFASGTLLFWRSAARGALATETGRIMTLGAALSLSIGGVLASVVIGNDLGWRVVLFAQVAAFCWTVAAVARWIAERRMAGEPARPPALVTVLGLVGIATSLYGLAMQRAYPWANDPDTAFINARPDVDAALRRAYGWANDHLALETVLQHNPGRPRVFDFGLYSRHRVGVADPEARLYGADAGSVRERIDALLPVFVRTLSGAEVRERAVRAGIGALVVTAADPVWQDRGSWVWSSRPLHDGDLVRIVSVGDL